MKFFAQSTYSYIENQIARWAESGGKLMLMAPSMPAAVVLDVGLRLTDYSIENASIGKVLIKVAAPLVDEWLNSPDRSIQKAAREVIGNKWRDDNENLTCYRNLPYEGEDLLVILLIGINRITDSSSMADFHHCDLHTIWKEELKENFSVWIQAKLKENQIGYEENDAAVKHFNMILHPLIERGLADIIQISELFDDIDLSAAQDGRDALKVLLSSLSRFRLPNFSSFRFANRQTFGPYIDSAISFFNYTAYREEKKRQKALKTLEDFVDNMQLGEIFSPDERKPFCNDQEFIEALKQYIREDDRTSREKLLQSDFVVIHDRLLKFKPPQEPKHRKETVVKLSGSPIEMILNALWITLGDFKKNAMNQGLFAHEALNSICITSTEFKHDCDGESPQ